MAGYIDDNLMNLLTEFLVHEIDVRVLDGITYAFVLKPDKKKDRNTAKENEKYAKYMHIKEETRNLGFNNDEVFRAYEVSNGYIFDMDIREAKKITVALAKAVANSTGSKTIPKNLIGDGPDKRRIEDMKRLARYAKQEFDAGRKKIEVALFSRNRGPRITITGSDGNGNPIALQYGAYAIRHWDIEMVNEKLLVPAGFRISKIEPCEILPSKTGVRFIMYLESLNRFR